MPLLSNPRLGDQFCTTVYLQQLQLGLTASHTGNWSHPQWTCSEHGPRRARTAHMEDTPGASGSGDLGGLCHWATQKTLLTGRCNYISDCCCSVTKSCPALCYPMNCSTPDFPVFYCLQKFAQTHVHWVSDTIQPSHPLLPSSPLALNLSQIRVFSSEWVLGFR